jgi:hypothetical protein
LPRRLGRPVDDLRDLVERDAEPVVELEGEPLGRRQRLEDDEQREPDRVGEQRLVLRIGLEVGADDRLREPAADVVLAARATRAEQVETDTGDDRRQPRAQILDRGAADRRFDPRLYAGCVALARPHARARLGPKLCAWL